MHICAEHLHKGHELEFVRAVSEPPLTLSLVQNAAPNTPSVPSFARFGRPPLLNGEGRGEVKTRT